MEKNTISKFFDVLSSKINCCFLTKNTVSKLNFLKFEERNSIDYLSNLWLRFWRTSLRLPIMLVVILMTGYVSNGQSIKGVVPVQCPHGGSGVDGDAFADTPVIGIGDLFDNNAGSGGGVINLTPPPEFLCSGPTFRLADAWGGDVQDPTIFTGSNKINDNPSDPDGPGPLTGGYTWGPGSSPNKNEIQNCGVHFTYGDPNVIGTVEGTSYAVAGNSTDLWCLFAGDRQVTNGSSYIDFEFLQATLTMFGTTSGGFVSEGTDGGRTLGDILVTIEFTQGGGDATVVIRRWEAKAGGGFEYVVRPNSLFQGGIYCTNNTSPTFVPFDVYGSGAAGGTYAVNQWAEGAINLTKVFGLDQPGHECFVLSTVFIRTRSSGSSAQSELKDFPGAPIQLNLCTDEIPPVISALPGPTTVECPGTPSFATPTATDNCELKSLTFADVTTPGSCPQEYSVTRTWTATDACGNVSTASQTIGVTDNTAPTLTSLPAPSSIECPATPSFATPTATDACDTSVTPTFADVTTPGGCPQEYSVTRTWTATDDCGNSSTASQTISVTDNTAPVLSALPAPSSIECPATPVFTIPTATDACDASVTPTFIDVTTPGSCPQEYSVTRTWTATDDCGNSSSASETISVTDNTAPVLSALPAPSSIECPATPVFTTPTATDACDQSVTPTFADVTTPGSCPQEYSVTRTWTATDDCGNSSSASQTISVTDNTAPVLSELPAPSSVECPATPVFTTPTATDACDASVTPTFADVTTPGSCPQEYSVTRTWTATDDCGNSSTASQTISVTDNTVPTITCVANKTIECNEELNFDPPTATDSCSGTATVSIVSTVTNADGSQTRTWKATDACGNESEPCSQTISVTPCAHIFPTQTTCCHFSTGTAIGLNNVCTTVSGTTVTNAVPGVFFYYSNVIAPAASFTIVVKQSNDGDLNKLFSIQNSGQLRLFTSSCETVTFTGSVINGGKDASYSVTGATPGATYIVSVKYDVKSIIGAVYSGADLVSKYTFASFINGSLTAALGSTGTIDAVAGCTDNTPLPGSCSITAKAPTTKDVAPIEAEIENVGFDAYPVPFKDQLTIKYKFDYTSDVKIELFNAQGVLVLSKTDSHSYLNKEITLNLKASKGQEQVYFVKVTTNRGTTSKKVMSSR